MDDNNAAKLEMAEQIREQKQLARLKDNDDVKKLFDYQFKVAALKMIWCFTGNNVTNWDEFCKLRGEVVARLEPIQTVNGAEAQARLLTEQLTQMFDPSDNPI
jgi:hypothetical protein